DEVDDQNQNDRRDVEAAEIGHEVADRRQQRFGDSVQELGHGADELVARIHDIERNQPGQDRGGDQQVDVEIEDDQDDVEDGAHAGGTLGFGRGGFPLLNIGSPPPKQGKSPAKGPGKRRFSPLLNGAFLDLTLVRI